MTLDDHSLAILKQGPQTTHGLALELSKRLPERDRAAGRVVTGTTARRALEGLETAGRVTRSREWVTMATAGGGQTRCVATVWRVIERTKTKATNAM